jgi:ABC-type Na+ transport system ATPase subunit NatA
MIKVQDLVKSFDSRFAVRKLSFQAPDGAITGLLGANGAGKTTTLRMICGVLKPDSGCFSSSSPRRGERGPASCRWLDNNYTSKA